MPEQQTFYSFDNLHYDSEGFLWAHRPADLWDAFNPDGLWMGSVHIPGIPLHIGRDHILTRHVGLYDVQHVRVYTLDRSTATRVSSVATKPSN